MNKQEIKQQLLRWRVELSEEETGAKQQGTRRMSGKSALKPGRTQIGATLPAGHLREITAKLRFRDEGTGETQILGFPITEETRIYMNGFQSWTWCPEYTVRDRIRGVGHLPRFGVDRFSLDRYADYHFFNYPDRRGYLHGYSFCYFRNGDRVLLIGSLDELPGYTMFLYSAPRGILTLKRDCALVRCGGELSLFDLFIAEGTMDEVFDAWFAAMGIVCRTQEKIAGYSSWYNRYQQISEESIGEDLEGAAKMLSPGDLFQIDDGWEPFIGDWLEADAAKFPRGMKDAADKIHAAGFRAGLWMAPFVAEEKSDLFRHHPDWFLKVDGAPWKDGCNWSGYYSLDIDHPEVIGYLQKVFHKVLFEWGYDLVKLDFLYGAAPFGNERESRSARMTRAMRMLREWCGEKLILGCGVPLYPAFGLVDYCRVSCDVTLDWDDTAYMRLIHRERPSTKQAIENDRVRVFLNGRAFGNDPDVFFLREDNLKLTRAQKEMLAETCATCGNVFLTSDNMASYTKVQQEQYRELRKKAGL